MTLSMKRFIVIALALLLAWPAFKILSEFKDERPHSEKSAAVHDTQAQIARGNYLVRAGNCMACHTAHGDQPYAGGHSLSTPFGMFYTPNITPDISTGIGSWSSDDFWHALHFGKSKDNRFLYPAFPYPNYTKISRADADAMYAYLKTLPAIHHKNHEHTLKFPYNYRALLAVWRSLYFQPGAYLPDSHQSPEWNRGAYLVEGLGHCNACHATHNSLGATNSQTLAGSLLLDQDWYAPSLSATKGTLATPQQIQTTVDLLKTGVSKKGAVFGPMADVVYESLQYLSDGDINAMVIYLKTLPETITPPEIRSPEVPFRDRQKTLILGAYTYQRHCVECHQASGQGIPPHYPPLAGNRAITTHSAVNAIRMVLNGGYPPSTSNNPRPYGMPPFRHILNDDEVAAVVSYILGSWGNHEEPVSAIEVDRYRSVPQ